ncbi:conjugal transfer protein [Bacillus paralicheniformis]|uniref:conjugal transfer protein n=1 Tax=Bacillus paralicheniformis TaxID=1648923 RepID=UPI002DBF801E|nr:conjugal transfer protein [Bacillus paralicheniformis]MEC1053547.1 conjugal transfer protein [Bacillus paralicheniformis]MEC1088545.1 conjugal transfer protein [Bacillus paralicheniformis]MEC1104895.1 conjugal transfer protein [Bacillus paralicheniformis]MEC1112144.1 conjugal transfer protein [Bacillus paralicheniformis]MEC1141160.1 conjugal transfer protein [Bacillus paralicheniformis]
MPEKESLPEKKEESFFRSVIQKIKRVQRPEKAKKKVPRDRSKIVAVTLWSCLSVLLLFSLLSAFLSVNTRSVVNDIRINSNKPSDQDKQKISVPAAENYLEGFIGEYVNVKNDHESIEKRKQNLENYMVKQTESNYEESERFQLDGLKGDRVLNDYSLYNVKEGDNYSIFQYKVTYTNLFPVEKEVEKTVKDGKKKKKVKEKVTENEKAEKQLLLNIPVISKGDSFAVSAVPYFTQIYDLKGDITIKKDEARDEYTGERKESIEKFLHTFFEKYASEKKEDMVYMMKEPEALAESLVFGEITDMKIFETKNGFEVFCVVQFKEKENEIPVVENFSLKLTENSGQYYVGNLKHQ